MATVALIDYGSGNLRSAEKALARAAADAGTGQQIVVTSDAREVAKADRIVLPGVGAFGDCIDSLSALPGMIDALNDAVRKQGVPFLGICVGMQLMASIGREFGEHKGLGWIDGEVVKITPGDPELKIPHMGWNELKLTREHPVLAGMGGTNVYFVHSYCFKPASRSDILATTDYAGEIVASLAKDNMVGVQFHPEKSQGKGLALLGNFLRWKP